MSSLCAAIGEGAGAAVLVDASFSPAELEALRDALRAQPTWSDLPILLVCADVERDEARPRMRRLVEILQPVGDVHLVERPLEGWMLVTQFTAALRARRHQYAARALLEQLDLERRRLLAVLAALPVGIAVVDADGRLIETNAAAQRIWGAMPTTQDAQDFRVFRAWRAGAGQGSRPFEWRFSRVLATGQPAIEEELEIDAFDGVRRTILTSALPTRGAQGEVTGAVSVQV
ncbi:two-component hybrid sensor and regulator [Minicystis rosea]|nr:two-component hybrid sensor and regulator [Minicystis rosea]